jgi:hypothetical protein
VAGPNLSRAYEIALLGGFKLRVVFQKDYAQGFDDYEEIKLFYGPEIFSRDGEITVEIYEPDHKGGAVYETLEDIKGRVDEARANPLPESFGRSVSACESLLDTATRKLSLSLSDREKAISIAKVVAQSDGSGEIEVAHIAEGIHYLSNILNGAICVAEERSLTFGRGISISTAELGEDDIRAAIGHLQSLLKEGHGIGAAL